MEYILSRETVFIYTSREGLKFYLVYENDFFFLENQNRIIFILLLYIDSVNINKYYFELFSKMKLLPRPTLNKN